MTFVHSYVLLNVMSLPVISNLLPSGLHFYIYTDFIRTLIYRLQDESCKCILTGQFQFSLYLFFTFVLCPERKTARH